LSSSRSRSRSCSDREQQHRDVYLLSIYI
jgi:hypothetical protein